LEKRNGTPKQKRPLCEEKGDGKANDEQGLMIFKTAGQGPNSYQPSTIWKTDRNRAKIRPLKEKVPSTLLIGHTPTELFSFENLAH